MIFGVGMMNREKIKTLILACLVVMSIIFTQKVWFYYPMQIWPVETSVADKDLLKLEARNELIVPERAIVNFGNNNYTIITSNIRRTWEETKGTISLYFQGEPEITSVTYEKYRENSRLKSIELEFGEGIPSILIASIFNSLDNKIVNDIKEIKNILLPITSRESIYIISKENNVYEIKLSGLQEQNNLTAHINTLQATRHIKYHPLFMDVDNYTLMPLNYGEQIPFVFVESEIDIADEAMVVEKAKTFFNENLDFVKTIKETSGALVFMYGYGEKGVRISNRGRLEYTEEIGTEFSTDAVTALDVAIDFIKKHGGFPKNAYLKRTKHENKNGYYFAFDYRIEGLPVEFNNPNLVHPIEIEVYGNKVKYFRSFVRKNMGLPDVNSNNGVALPHKAIENNIELLISNYIIDLDVKEEISDKNILNYIEKDISKLELVYYDMIDETRRQLLIPAWKIKINKRVYYFNCYDSKLLYSKILN